MLYIYFGQVGPLGQNPHDIIFRPPVLNHGDVIVAIMLQRKGAELITMSATKIRREKRVDPPFHEVLVQNVTVRPQLWKANTPICKDVKSTARGWEWAGWPVGAGWAGRDRLG